MISIVVVYNDRSLFDAMLGASLARQLQAHELIALDNTTGRFPSAAAALNEGGRRALGDFLLFAHQDVSFESNAWLEQAEHLLRGMADIGIAGVAGTRAAADRADPFILTNIEHSDPPHRVGHQAITAAVSVATVDECAFFVPRAVFERFPFDEHACDGWHLYAVDYSLTVRAAGLLVYAIPLPLYHRSGGAYMRLMGVTTLEGTYFRGLKRLVEKHRDRYDTIPTTCGTWSTRRGLFLQRFPPADVLRSVAGWARQRWRDVVHGSHHRVNTP